MMPQTPTKATMTTARLLLCALAVLSTLANARAHAQSANDILDASRQAIAETTGFQAQFRMSGEGGSMFADTMPSMSGQLFFGTREDLGRVIHTIGEGRDKQKDPPRPVDQIISTDRFVWVDREAQTITEAPNTANARGVPSSLTLVLVSPIVESDPFAKDANRAESITLAGAEEVAGVMCDQIAIKLAKPEGSAGRASTSYTDVIWWIGQEDKLPRRVHQITDAGMVKITLAFEMSNLRLMEPREDQLDVRRPEGFRTISKMPKPRTQTPPQTTDQSPDVEVSTTTETLDRTPATTTPPSAPSKPLAPSFSFSTSAGRVVDNTTQRGRVTALYFRGSWCIPCAQTGPLVSTLSSDIEDDRLDLIALSVREGDPTRVEREFTARYPDIPLSVNPGTISADFKVRIFPSIVVIDGSGAIVFQRSIGKGYSAESLVIDAQQAVETALGER